VESITWGLDGLYLMLNPVILIDPVIGRRPLGQLEKGEVSDVPGKAPAHQTVPDQLQVLVSQSRPVQDHHPVGILDITVHLRGTQARPHGFSCHRRSHRRDLGFRLRSGHLSPDNGNSSQLGAQHVKC
jgi:hypothetical protein